MNFKDILREMIVEASINKGLLNSLYKKWNSQNDRFTPEVVEYILKLFKGGTNEEGKRVEGLQNSLSPKKQEVKYFLKRFSGDYGYDRFEPDNLKTIDAYSAEQIEFLFRQLGKPLPFSEEEKKKLFFFEDPYVQKNEWVEESKKYWYGDEYKVYDDGNGFRIYQPTSEKVSVLFGFYQKYLITNNFPHGNKWCVTSYAGANDVHSNLWSRYRKDYNGGRTFFFVIDETKELNNEFHISAIQKLGTPEGDYPYKITNLNNTNGDASVKIDDPQHPNSSLKHIYPQFRETDFLETREPIPFDEAKEQDLKNISETQRLLNEITERPGPYNFSIQPPDIKDAYINAGNELFQLESFESLSDEQIKRYHEIRYNPDPGATQNPYDIIKTWEILDYVFNKRGAGLKKGLNDFYSNKMNVTQVDLFKNITKSEYEDAFSVKNSGGLLEIVQKRGGKELGIIHFESGTFLRYEGVEYSPLYTEIFSYYGSFDMSMSKDVEPIDDEPMDDEPMDVDNVEDNEFQDELQEQNTEGKQFIIQVYSRSGNLDDNNNFYTVIEPFDEESGDDADQVILLTHKTWKSIEPYFIDSDDTDDEKSYDDISLRFTKAINEKGGN